jgi:hypothetical protein
MHPSQWGILASKPGVSEIASVIRFLSQQEGERQDRKLVVRGVLEVTHISVHLSLEWI